MRLVVVIVQDYDVDRLLREVAAAGLRATRLASTGGFLRTGNTTVLLGVSDQLLDRCLALVAGCCRSRTVAAPTPTGDDAFALDASGVAGDRLGGGVVFVARVARFERVD